MLSTRLLLLAVLLVPACSGGGGSGGGTPTAPPGPQTVVVEVRDFTFEPRSVTVNPGDTVRWRFVGSDTTHTVTATGGVFDSGFVFTSPGATFERTFTEAELDMTFEYRCVSHHECCAMQGSVRVGASAPPPSPGY
jgi:plastocyanin